MKNSQRGFVVPLLIIIAVLVIGGGIYFWQKNKNTVPVSVVSSSTSSSWQTYIGNIFSINYPQGWTIIDKKQDSTFENYAIFKAPDSSATGTPTSLSVDVWPIIKGVRDASTLANEFIKDSSLNGLQESNVTIGNIPAVEFSGSDSITGPDAFILFDNGGYTYSVDATGEAVDAEVFNQFYQSFKFTSSAATTSATMSVSGMQQYTDSNFGFSFWYPSIWQIAQTSVQNPSQYLGGTIQKQLLIQNNSDRNITIAEVYSPTSAITSIPFVCTVSYSFDSQRHQWMETTSDCDGAGTSPANVSVNTMGGLHEFVGSAQFALETIVPLSAHNFLVVTYTGNTPYTPNQNPLVDTIVATDPSVATPVSATEQTQTIQAEANAYGVVVATAPTNTTGWQTYMGNGFSFQYPTNLNSSYVRLSNPSEVFVATDSTSNSSIDSNGCYIPSIFKGSPDAYKPTQIILNGISFCESISLNPAMGSVSGDYYFTTLKNGTYITIGYGVAAPNGCGALFGEPGYQSCEDFENNYNAIVIQPLEQSAGTLTFTNSKP